MADFKADIDDEGTVFLQIGGDSVAFATPDRICAASVSTGTFAGGRPTKPGNPTGWPPVVVYARDPTAGSDLIKMDLRDLMTVEVEDVEVVVRSVRALPWARHGARLLLNVSDRQVEAAVKSALRQAMGPAMPELRVTTALTDD